MARPRSQFNKFIAVPDSQGVLSIAVGAKVIVTDRDLGPVTVYTTETGPPASADAGTGVVTLTADAQGRVGGWLEDGRYLFRVSFDGKNYQYALDAHSGGGIEVYRDGRPSTVDGQTDAKSLQPQIEIADGPGQRPAINFGPGGDNPADISIGRTGTSEVTLKSMSSGLPLKTIIEGDLVLSGPDNTVDMNGGRLSSVGPPDTGSDAANKAYVDAATGYQIQQGRIPNMPLTTPLASLTMSGVTTGNLYVTRVEIPSLSLSSIEFTAGANITGNVQFGIFAERLIENGDEDNPADYRLECIAVTGLDISNSWLKDKAKTLAVGYPLDPSGFEESPRNLSLPASATGNLYAGVVATSAAKLLGATVPSPAVSSDLGLPLLDAPPILAGKSSSSAGLLAEGTDYDRPTRSNEIPFCRIRV